MPLNKKHIPKYILNVILFIPILLICYNTYVGYLDMKQAGQFTTWFDYVKTFTVFDILRFMILLIGFIGSLISRVLGWIAMTFTIYYLLIYSIIVTQDHFDFSYLISFGVVVLILGYQNSIYIASKYNVMKRNLVTYNLIALAIAVSVVLISKDFIIN